MENLMEWELESEAEVLGGNLPQFHFLHHKYHMTWPGIETGCHGEKPATNRNDGTAFYITQNASIQAYRAMTT
jgi:hypothetical protein